MSFSDDIPASIPEIPSKLPTSSNMKRLVKVKDKKTETNATSSIDAGKQPASARQVKFMPNIPARRTVRKQAKQEENVKQEPLDEGFQALINRSKETTIPGPFGRRVAFGDIKRKPTARIAFGFGASSNSYSAPPPPKVKQDPDADMTGVTHVTREQQEDSSPWNHHTDFPTLLPLQKPGAGEPETAVEPDFDEDISVPSEELNLLEESQSERLLFFQLPSSLPLKQTPDPNLDPETSQILPDSHLTPLKNLPSGFVGKLKIYKSGAVKLHFENSVFEAFPGSKTVFHQELIVVDVENKVSHFIGDVSQRVVLTPAMDDML